MKRKILLILLSAICVLWFSFGFTACGGESEYLSGGSKNGCSGTSDAVGVAPGGNGCSGWNGTMTTK